MALAPLSSVATKDILNYNERKSDYEYYIITGIFREKALVIYTMNQRICRSRDQRGSKRCLKAKNVSFDENSFVTLSGIKYFVEKWKTMHFAQNIVIACFSKGKDIFYGQTCPKFNLKAAILQNPRIEPTFWNEVTFQVK